MTFSVHKFFSCLWGIYNYWSKSAPKKELGGCSICLKHLYKRFFRYLGSSMLYNSCSNLTVFVSFVDGGWGCLYVYVFHPTFVLYNSYYGLTLLSVLWSGWGCLCVRVFHPTFTWFCHANIILNQLLQSLLVRPIMLFYRTELLFNILSTFSRFC